MMRRLTLLSQRSPRVTTGRTHVRDGRSLRGVMGTLCLALMPCALMGLYNTGYQANLALARAAPGAPAGWRRAWLDAAGVPLDPDRIMACVAHGALYLVPALAVAWLAGAAWEHLFARARRRERVEGLFTTALVLVLLLPPAAPLWQVAVGMSFATVLAKELFGGTGLGFMNPAAVGVALLGLSYPSGPGEPALWSQLRGYSGTTVFNEIAAGGADAASGAAYSWGDAFLGLEQGAMGTTSALACAAGALLLLFRGTISWRILAGVLVGSGLAVLLARAGVLASNPVADLAWHRHLVLGGLAFGAVFLATDPATSALTAPGRWALGTITGFLIVLTRVANPLHPDGVVFAVLLANVVTPLVDQGVVWLNVRRRRRRHG